MELNHAIEVIENLLDYAIELKGGYLEGYDAIIEEGKQLLKELKDK